MESLVIKKYSNRRLYNATTGRYTSTRELSDFIRSGTDFTVVDHTGKDITRYVLMQMVVELEGKASCALLSPSLLRQLICLGDSELRSSVPAYLDQMTGLLKSLSR